MIVESVEQTCLACPSQWEGRLTDGRMFYVRYRWGHLSLSVSPGPTTDIFEAVDGEEVYSEATGSEYDGVISWDEVCNKTGLKQS